MKKMDLTNRPVRGTKTRKSSPSIMTISNVPIARACIQRCFRELLKEYGGQVQFVYKDFPLSEIHPWAMHAAVNANCLAAQNTMRIGISRITCITISAKLIL
jgi:hypothetical protein